MKTWGQAAAMLSVLGLVWLAGCSQDSKKGRVYGDQPQYRETGGMVRAEQYWPGNVREGALLLVEKSAPAEVRANQPFQYEIRVTNVSRIELRDVVVSDSLPEKMEITQSTPAADTGKSGWAMWKFDRLMPNQTQVIQVEGNATAQTCLQTCTDVTYRLGPVCMNINVVQPMLALTLEVPRERLLCDCIPVRFIVRNEGTGTLNNVVIRDTLPQGLTTPDGNNTVNIDVGTLRQGETKEYNVELKANSTGTFNQQAVATAEGGLKAEAGGSTNVVKPELAINVNGPQTQWIGGNVTYTITVTNNSQTPAQHTVLTYGLPEGTQFINAGNEGRFDRGKISWELGTLNANDSRKVTFSIRACQAGLMHNEAVATALCAEAKTSFSTDIRGIAALTVCAVPDCNPVRVGQRTTYTITLNNPGSAADTNVVLKATLPDGMEYVSSDGPTKGTADGRTVTFEPIKSFDSRTDITYKITVKATKAGDVRFRTSLTSDGLKGGPVESQQATNIFE